MAWDPGIEGFLHVRTMVRLGMTQWHIWYCSTIRGYNGEQHSKRELVRALLEDKQFWRGGLSCPQLLIILLKEILKFSILVNNKYFSANKLREMGYDGSV